MTPFVVEFGAARALASTKNATWPASDPVA